MRVINEATNELDYAEEVGLQPVKDLALDDPCEKETVCVFMSTYNGEKYLRRQLDTILCQIGVSVELRVRDDGSTDGTRKILNDYMETHSNIQIHYGENLGYSRSFFWLIDNVETDACYFAFADQDDIWDSDKLAVAVSAIKEEEAHCLDAPVLYAGTTRIMDAKEHYIRTDTELKSKGGRYALLARGVNGNTMLYNAKLRNLVRRRHRIDERTHDGYVVALACFLGKVIFDNRPHQNWRRHEESFTSGLTAGQPRGGFIASGLSAFSRRMLPEFQHIIEQRAQFILDSFSAELDASGKADALLVASYRKSPLKRFRLLTSRSFTTGLPVSFRLYFCTTVICGVF